MRNNVKNMTPALFAEEKSRGAWKRALHLRCLDNILMDMFSGNISKLMINMPPRHGKSEFISKYLPAWHLLRFPGKKIILTSYSSTFSALWGRQVMALLSNTCNVKFSKNARSAKEFQINGYDGGMICVGTGGSITGRGADLIIIDDPVKNDTEANSPVIRDNLWEWYRSTIFTRLEPGGKMIIIMTRWHHDDLSGRILNSVNKKKWTTVNMAAIAKENDLFRSPGEPLWEERFPLSLLNEIKVSTGMHWFEAMYQQSPTPKESGIFSPENFKYFEITDNLVVLHNNDKKQTFLRNNISIFSTADLAASKSEMSDYTVILTFGITKKNQILIFDVIRNKFETADHFNIISNYYHKWKPSLIGIESVQYQISLTEQLSRAGFPVKKLKATKDKVSRALAIAAKMENGEVYFLRDAKWLESFEKELLEFPNSAHDDQVDAFAYIAQLMTPGTHSLPLGGRKRSGLTSGF